MRSLAIVLLTPNYVTKLLVCLLAFKVGFTFKGRRKLLVGSSFGTWASLAATRWKRLTAEPTWAQELSRISTLTITKAWEGEGERELGLKNALVTMIDSWHNNRLFPSPNSQIILSTGIRS